MAEEGRISSLAGHGKGGGCEINWTKEQQQAIDSRGSLLISASAGSGKTGTLVQRAVNKLISGECSIKNLLIISFSNAATEEIYSRIASKLQQANQQQLLEEFRNYGTKSISTIHSFCLKLIKENADVLKIDPSCKIAADHELVWLKEQAFNDTMEWFCTKHDQRQVAMLNEFSSGTHKLSSNLGKLYDFVRSKPFYREQLDSIAAYYCQKQAPNDPFMQVIVCHCHKVISHCIQQLEWSIQLEIIDASLKDQLATLSNTLKCAQAAATTQDLQRYIDILDVAPLLSSKRASASDSQRQLAETIKGICKQINSIKNMWLYCDPANLKQDKQHSANYFKLLIRFAKAFDRYFCQHKRRNNLIDFHDMEQLVLLLLLSKKDDGRWEKNKFAEKISTEFKEILIDEYQDINEIQNLIFETISNQKTTTFLVGDVKQSIYRFRYAAPEIFLAKESCLPEYNGKQFPAKLQLKSNFRSAPSIINAVNFIFARLMTQNTVSFEYDNAHKLMATRPHTGNSGVCIDIIEHEGSAEQSTRLEAEYIALQIEQKLNDSSFLICEGATTRRAEYRDFCILLRSLENKSDYYLDALTQRNIPTLAKPCTDFFNQKEIRLLVALLKTINNPMNEAELVTVMCSCFGFSLAEIYTLREVDPRLPLYLMADKMAAQKGKNLVKNLSFCKQKAALSSMPELISYIYGEKWFVNGAINRSGGQEAAKNRLDRFLDLAASGPNKSLPDFIEYLDLIMQKIPNPFPAKALPNNPNAVNVLSIHKSKGLEFPVCFLGNSNKEFNCRELQDSLLFHHKLPASCTFYNKQNMQCRPTIFKLATTIALQNDMLAEELRLLYVAMTRAKESFIVPIVTKDFADKQSRLTSDAQNLDQISLQKHRKYADLILLALFSNKNHCEHAGTKSTCATDSGAICNVRFPDLDSGWQMKQDSQNG
ncbi:MAG: UvrD-helicase domain-containing protein, partial [Oscillospiraceae bacterium]|nr:UvrD-helicase domain-containing protein [Oscillospiraceae bacterium]